MNLSTLFFIMVGVFVSYISFIWSKYGVLKSISESYYSLPKKINFLFTFFCWGFAFPAIIIGTELTNNFLMFLGGTGIIFVGAAAAMKTGMTRKVHWVSAVIGIVFSQLSIAIDFNLWWLATIISLLSVIMLIFKLKHSFWWIEILAIVSTSIVLGLNIFL